MGHATQDAVATCLSDLLGVEQHLQKSLASQIDGLENDALDLGWELSRVHETCRRHGAALEELAHRREHTALGFTGTFRKAASSFFGIGAAAIDLVRSGNLPKGLHDDYVAAQVACIGYVMLHTTAMTLGDTEAAELATRHLKSHAKSAIALQEVVPLAIVQFLRDDGLPVRENVLPAVHRNILTALMPDVHMSATFATESRP